MFYLFFNLLYDIFGIPFLFFPRTTFQSLRNYENYIYGCFIFHMRFSCPFPLRVCECMHMYASMFVPFSSLDTDNYIKVGVCCWIVWGGLG